MKTSLIQSLGFNPVSDLPSCDTWDEVMLTLSHDGLPGGSQRHQKTIETNSAERSPGSLGFIVKGFELQESGSDPFC